MKYDRWAEYWSKYGREGMSKNEQEQVLRTYNKKPISPEKWQFTLDDLDAKFPVGRDDDLLDLCCGNGLFASYYARKCRSVIGVDINANLLKVLERRCLNNVKTVLADIREAHFSDGIFSRILFYAGIQYITEGETVSLFRNLAKWLRPGGLLFVGDVPDRSLLWAFYDTPEREKLYFDNCVTGTDVVGTWFDRNWLETLARHAGFNSAEALSQDPNLIYARFRFDLICRR